MTQTYTYRTDARALEEARGAWLSLAGERSRRERFKAFTYGRQWGDQCLTTDGRRVSEERRMTEEGRLPVTNNIIRQLVKSVIGRYRHLCGQGAEAGQASLAGFSGEGAVSNTDARTLEEFLISGKAIQRLERGEATQVSPALFFHQPFSKPDGSDCRLMGMLHDMGLGEACRRFGEGDPRRVRALKDALRRGAGMGSPWPQAWGPAGFDTPGKPGTWRVVELWRLVPFESLEVEDLANGTRYRRECGDLERLEGLNAGRACVGTPPLRWVHRVQERWTCTWLTAAGEVLGSRVAPRGERPPFALCFYPLVDGEVHSLVEDVIDQQKYVNRLISLLDHIISSSAKGVLLYPADQLPEGFTWKDIRRIWANPNGILPFKRTAKGMVPQQVSASGAGGAQATEMLKMQLQLFEEISGATGAVRGRSSTAQGEGMLRAEMENALVSMLDILATFRAYVMERDERLDKKNVKPVNKEIDGNGNEDGKEG